MQTILGAGGAIGTELARELLGYTSQIRLVSRQPKKVNEKDQLVRANLTEATEVDKAVAGSSIVYLVAGIEYKTKVWQKQWPQIMRHVIDACKKHGAKLVFFDNVYMYDKNSLHTMTEQTPVKPVSKKGAVRATIAQMLMDEVKKGELTAMIVRAADFIGLKNSVVVEMVAKNLLKGKKAQWLTNANTLHNFTYVPDAAKATALLGNTPSAYNQVWHLPTPRTPLTGKDWVQLFSTEIGVPPKYTTISTSAMGLLGIFVPVLREFKEMAYQYSHNYVFDSSRFEQQFNIQPTPPQEAVQQIVQSLRKQ